MMSIQKWRDERGASGVIHRYQNLPSMWRLIEAEPNPNQRRSRNSRLLLYVSVACGSHTAEPSQMIGALVHPRG